MKKQYQINKQRAAKEFQSWAANNEEPIQLTFPTADIAELAQSSLGDLLRAVGKLFIETVMGAFRRRAVKFLSSEGPNVYRQYLRTLSRCWGEMVRSSELSRPTGDVLTQGRMPE